MSLTFYTVTFKDTCDFEEILAYFSHSSAADTVALQENLG